MKQFRTELKVTPSRQQFDLKSPVLTQGSCFADAIGDRLATFKVPALVNPFGVIYNPESIHKVLSYSIFNEPLPDHTFIRHQDVFFNYNFHSQFSSLHKEALTSRLVNTIGLTHYFLKDADWIVLTYGTAWVYRRNDTGEVVANCHKLPSATFTKSLLSALDVLSSFKTFYSQLKTLNPRIRIILTVSPVRHIKDTLELNNVSKSVLVVAAYLIASQYDDVEYFPAYELMMDDLRDYRFYKADMLHPSAEAEDYIWEKFMERYFSPPLKEFAIRWSVILSALRHRPFHPHSRSHQQFLKETIRKLEEVSEVVDVEHEMTFIKQQLIK